MPSIDPATRPDCPGYFDDMFGKSDDPWQFQTRWYERRKRALTLACLPHERYSSGFEPCCANGELSAELALRCDSLLVTDGIDKAVALASHRLREHPHVKLRKAWMPDDWPNEKFDLIVLSEFLFSLQPAQVEEIALKAMASLHDGGVLVACHWRHAIDHCALTGDSAHGLLQRFIHLPQHCHVVEPDFRLDVWSSAPTVAQREGIC